MRIAIIILSVVLLIVLIVWVFPKVPYTRRLSEDKAFDLYKEYLSIIEKSSIGPVGGIRKDEIAERLAYAGYVIVADRGAEGKQVFPLRYPSYA